MPLDDLAAQRRSLGLARLPDGRLVSTLPGAYATLVIVLTPDGPQLQGSQLTPDDADAIADAARDTALALRRDDPNLAGYVQECWERRRRWQLAREMNAFRRRTAAQEPSRPTVERATDPGGTE